MHPLSRFRQALGIALLMWADPRTSRAILLVLAAGAITTTLMLLPH